MRRFCEPCGEVFGVKLCGGSVMQLTCSVLLRTRLRRMHLAQEFPEKMSKMAQDSRGSWPRAI